MLPSFTERVWMRSREGEGRCRFTDLRSFPFPPAGGREGLAFRSEALSHRTWAVAIDRARTPALYSDPGDQTLLTAEIGGQTIEFRIVEVTGDMLPLEWPRP